MGYSHSSLCNRGMTQVEVKNMEETEENIRSVLMEAAGKTIPWKNKRMQSVSWWTEELSNDKTAKKNTGKVQVYS